MFLFICSKFNFLASSGNVSFLFVVVWNLGISISYSLYFSSSLDWQAFGLVELRFSLARDFSVYLEKLTGSLLILISVYQQFIKKKYSVGFAHYQQLIINNVSYVGLLFLNDVYNLFLAPTDS